MLRVPCLAFLTPLAATRRSHNRSQAPVPARVSAGRLSPGLAIASCHHRGWRVSAPKLLLLLFACTSTSATRCLTPRSSGAPTAGHQARSGGTRYIFASPGLASCRRRPLSSNVRQRKEPVLAYCQTARLPGLVFAHSSLNVGGSLPTLVGPYRTSSAGLQTLPSASACPRERGPAVTAACHHPMPPPWLARERAKVAPAALCLHRHHRGALPNPSFKQSPNGVPRGPGRQYAVHFRQPGPRVPPSVPA